MNAAFCDYFRCPEKFAPFLPTSAPEEWSEPGYFQLAADITCYGRFMGTPTLEAGGELPDGKPLVKLRESACYLPFDPDEVAKNFRFERYVQNKKTGALKASIRQAYYLFRPLFPVAFRRHLQRLWLRGWDEKPHPKWPVDRTVDRMFMELMRSAIKVSGSDRVPFIWFWPQGKSSCAVMTHDVETAEGVKLSAMLMDINDSFEIKSSFQLIPGARYEVTDKVLASYKQRGFEVNVHDLKHDGHLFDDYESFVKSAQEINQHAKRFGTEGFRAGALYRNQEWFSEFQMSYDMSVPNVAHLDPQQGGCCTVMPYFIGRMLEIPVTMLQDYTLFNVFNSHSTEIWSKQIKLVTEQHGLMNFIVHPDYLDSEEAVNCYKCLLTMLADLRGNSDAWVALPKEVNLWWRQRHAMTLVPDGSGWHLEGEGSEHARLAYATLEGDEVKFEVVN